MAARVDLIEGCFRCDGDFKADRRELLKVVRAVETPDGKSASALL